VLFSDIPDLPLELVAVLALAAELLLGGDGLVLVFGALLLERCDQRVQLLVFFDDLVQVSLDVVPNAMDVVFVAVLLFLQGCVTLCFSMRFSLSSCGSLALSSAVSGLRTRTPPRSGELWLKHSISCTGPGCFVSSIGR
jgi:hypothetical protein